jgi:hypothetical protein
MRVLIQIQLARQSAASGGVASEVKTMLFATNSIGTPACYEKIADELEAIAETVRKTPDFGVGHCHGLDPLAKEIRNGADKIRNIARH